MKARNLPPWPQRKPLPRESAAPPTFLLLGKGWETLLQTSGKLRREQGLGGEGGGRTCVPKAHGGCSLGEGRESGKPLGSGHREK